MRIAVDAMGGDNAPRAPIEGAVLAARRLGVPVVLVGQEPVVRAELARLSVEGLPIFVQHAATFIAMDDLNPAASVRADHDSSMARGMSLVRQGDADAFVTMGHTGAGLAGALLRLGRLPGIRRPALAVPFPTKRKPCVLLDVGANTDVRPADLAQFAVMGAAYSERVMGVTNPRVGLVSIGEEAGKGNEVVQAAWPLLEATALNFVGNVEGRDIPEGVVDVAVIDGFTGNVLIKFAEGVVGLVQHVIREAATADFLGRLGGALLRPSLARARKRMDYRAYGGAVLLGARGIVVIGHGRSDGDAVLTAIDVARKAVVNDVVGAIEAGVGAIEAGVAVPA